MYLYLSLAMTISAAIGFGYGLVVFKNRLVEFGFFIVRYLQTDAFEDFINIFHAFSFLHCLYPALPAVESQPDNLRRGSLGIKNAPYHVLIQRISYWIWV